MHSPGSARSLPHLHAPRALEFRVEDDVPESKRHLILRTLLFQVLTHAYADRAGIGSDQFVYWNAADPARCLAPDAFVRFGAPDDDFDTWKTWERGAPQLCVEITSRSDRADPDWDEKLASYRELGVLELVRFDPPTGRLRIWDRLDDDLVEREIEGGSSPCVVTGAFWIVVTDEGRPALRLARDPAGEHLLPTGREAAERREAEGEAKGKAEAVSNVLRLRGLVVDTAEDARIRETRDPALLDRWLERALVATSVAEVLAD